MSDDGASTTRSDPQYEHTAADEPAMSPLGQLARSVRLFSVDPPDDDAIEAVEELLPEGDRFWPYMRNFATLILLSSAIAAFGLLADSGAVVIGAMLVAPLMTPITAAAAALVTARNRRFATAAAVIAFGTALAIFIGWAISAVAGTTVTGADDLPQQVTSRTFPGLLDLGIAITAGAAAGYIAPRRSVTSALPGVGIAVALVPPLATVGITAHLGLRGEAWNALLLYLTNLAAIVFTASLMLLLAGFRPAVSARSHVSRRLVVTLLVVVAIAVPLTVHTRSSIQDISLRRSVTRAVVEWDDSVRIIKLDADAGSSVATVELLVSGPNSVQPAWELAEGIERRFGGAVDLRLLYQRDELYVVSVR